MAQVSPQPEVCGDFVDDDCDGTADDGCSTTTCAHDPCFEGVALNPACDPCVDLICGVLDSYCCSGEWDSFCTEYAYLYCTC